MYLNGTKCCSLIFSCLLSLSAFAKDAKVAVGQGLKKPLCFIENKGQVLDQDNNIRKDVQFKLSTPGMNLYLGNGQLHYQFNKIEQASATSFNSSSYRMDVTLLGANPDAKMIATEEQEYHENYYESKYATEGFTAHAYNRVTYKNVYPNIDWVLYVKNNQVEYDFVVRPGGNPADIKLEYGGATALSIAKDGSIAAETPMGNVTEKSPYAYETKTGKAVAANFHLNKNIVTFETGTYNESLTIDPYLLWGTYFGGTNEDVATSVKEATGNVTLVAGYTASTGLSVGAFISQPANAGGTYDAFLAKYSTNGTLTWATYFGGSSSDMATGVTVDNLATPGVYMVGYTTSSGIAFGGVYHTTNNGLNDGFLAKFNFTSGTRTWATYYGGTGNDYVYGVACDASNNVYITGQTGSATLVSSSSTVYQPNLSGTADAFVAKFSATGAIQWSTYYGGSAQETGYGITCDALNNVIITGQTNSVIGIATTGAYQTALSGTNDAFVAKFTTAGAISWATYFGGSGIEQGNGIACNTTTNALAIVGSTTSSDNIASPKAFQPVFAGGSQDAFAAYLTSAGSVVWSTYYGGAAVDYGQAVCFDLFKNVVITGGTFSSTGIASTGSYQSAIGGSYDAFLAKFNPIGQRLWGTYFGSTLYDYAYGVSCDNLDQIAIAGYTTSTSGIATTGTAQTTYGGGTYDGFAAKFKADTMVSIVQPYTDTVLCAGSTFNLSYTVNYSFAAGNTFTAQLSDASGSFASPVIIGNVTATAAGTISCTIPALAPVGTGYRIRIVASSPAFTSPDDFYDINILSVLPHTTATGTTPVCVGSTVNLYDTGIYEITSYNWAGPAGSGFTSATQNPVITSATLADAGTYSVVTTHNGCPNDTATVTIEVNSTIPPTPTDSASPVNCAGSSINLFANSGLATTVTYHWSGPSGYTSTDQNPIITGASGSNTGWYYVTDTLGGCPSATDSVHVTVTAVTPVSVSITATPGDTICAGTLVSFTATPLNGGIDPGYQWVNNGTPVVGAVTSTWASSSLGDGDDIYCIMTSNITCPSPINATSNVIKMNVISNPPIVYITASPGTNVAPGDTVTFTSVVWNGGVAPLYQWKLNGVVIAGATNSTYVLPGVEQNDTVSLTLTSVMACAVPDSAVSDTLVIHPVPTGVINVSSSLDNVALYPNPNKGSFNLKGYLGNTDIQAVSFEVLNPLGQVIYTSKATVNNNELNASIELNNLADGIYMLNINGDGRSKVLRFTVQR